MDKTLNRKILYSKVKGTTDDSKKEQPKPDKPAKPPKTEKEAPSSSVVVKWINDHPHFKWAAMCRKIGMDKGNFQRILNNPKSTIPAKFLPKIVEVIKEYGYAE